MGTDVPMNCRELSPKMPPVVVGHRLLHSRGTKWIFLLFGHIERVGVGRGMLTFLVSCTHAGCYAMEGLGWAGACLFLFHSRVHQPNFSSFELWYDFLKKKQSTPRRKRSFSGTSKIDGKIHRFTPPSE